MWQIFSSLVDRSSHRRMLHSVNRDSPPPAASIAFLSRARMGHSSPCRLRPVAAPSDVCWNLLPCLAQWHSSEILLALSWNSLLCKFYFVVLQQPRAPVFGQRCRVTTGRKKHNNHELSFSQENSSSGLVSLLMATVQRL